jgi:hypothetical protein
LHHSTLSGLSYTKVSNARLKVLRNVVQSVMAITDARSRFWQPKPVFGNRGSRTVLFMRYEHSNEHAPRTPLCASCAQAMRLARMTSRFGGLPDFYTFECRACGVSYIEAANIEREIGVSA